MCDLDSTRYASGATKCRAAGQGHSGEVCDADTDCAAGYGCFGVCRKYCETDNQCGETAICLTPATYTSNGVKKVVPGVKLCTAQCKPEGKINNGCPAGQACDLYHRGDTIYSECHAAGTRGEGQACTTYGDCKAGFSCIAFSSNFRICTQLCPVIGDDPYAAPKTCDGGGICRPFSLEDGWFLGTTEYGSCAP